MVPTTGKSGNVFNWFLPSRGAASLLFGCAVLGWAISDQSSLAICFFFYAFTDGLLALIFSFFRKDRGSWIFTAEGGASICASILTLLGPVAFSGIIAHTGSIFLPYFIIARFMVTGMLEVLALGFLGEAGRRTIALTGVVAVAFGGLLAFLLPGMQLFTSVLGGYSVFIGFCLIAMRFIFRAETG